MNKTLAPVESLSFRLDVEGDWPPVALESLPFRTTPDGYECQVAPLFVKNLAVGDVIAVTAESENVVDMWHHVRQSNHTTVWLLRLKSPNNISEVLDELRAIGCSTVGLPEVGSFAVDVPGTVDIAYVDGILSKLDSAAVAVAFPALRHPDS